jgi:hypothetical protein
MTAHDRLERQLRSSIADAAGRRPAPRLRRRRWSGGFSGLVIALSCVVTVGVAVVALVALHHRQPSTSVHRIPGHQRATASPGLPPKNADLAATAAAFNAAWKQDPGCNPAAGARSGTTSQGSPSAAMLATLPVLRRPAAPAVRLPAELYSGGRLRPGPFRGGDVYVRYLRRARVTNAISFYLVPAGRIGSPAVSQRTADRCYRLEVAALRAQLAKVPASKRAVTRRYGDSQFALGRRNLTISTVHEGVFLLDVRANGPIGLDGGQSPSTIQQTGMLGGSGGGTPSTRTVMDGIVPSGVATVTLQFPATHYRGHQLPALNASGNVINNVFVIAIPTLFQRGGWPTAAIWRAASGKIIKTVNERPFHP